MNDITTIEGTAHVVTPTPPPKLPRLTEQQRKFFEGFMRYGVATKAYRLAYQVKDTTDERTVWANASRLLNHSKVAPWIAWARRQATEDSFNTVMREFDQNRNGALEVGNYSAANGSTRGKAQVLGLIPHNRDGGAPAGTVINIIMVAADMEVL